MRGKENWSMEADTIRYCPYFSPYTSYSPYLSLWVLNCRLAISFAVRIYYKRTRYFKLEGTRARSRFPKSLGGIRHLSWTQVVQFIGSNYRVRQFPRNSSPGPLLQSRKYRPLRSPRALQQGYTLMCLSVRLSARHRPWWDFRFQFSQGIRD